VDGAGAFDGRGAVDAGGRVTTGTDGATVAPGEQAATAIAINPVAATVRTAL